MLVRIANREDPDQTASKEAVCSGSTLFAYAFFGRQLVFEILEHLLYSFTFLCGALCMLCSFA